ncbi:predicted protein [Botrytis cinerea T4]|uniref:Uncharacterized protein n=1 Tax=Botryotinia fuckeliana (strain T4) TaxID=999810 RepID=G2XRQ9_BOTF4|nr:predicted protein [Botrytis cinerea T4]
MKNHDRIFAYTEHFTLAILCKSFHPLPLPMPLQRVAFWCEKKKYDTAEMI